MGKERIGEGDHSGGDDDFVRVVRPWEEVGLGVAKGVLWPGINLIRGRHERSYDVNAHD